MISVIIRTYNEEKYILKLINAIHAQDVKDAVEIIVVDSGSTDHTVKIARACDGVQVITISKELFSYGFALNHGLHHARGDIAISISAHCIPVGRSWLRQLVEPFSDSCVAITYGRQRGPLMARPSERKIFANTFPISNKKYAGVVFNHNANSAFRMSAWRECPFDEELLGLEDYDFALKTISKNKNFKSIYVPSAEVLHFHHETNEKVFNRYYRETLSLKKIEPHQRPRISKILASFFKSILEDFLLSYRESSFIKSFFDVLGYRLSQHFATYAAYYELSRAGLRYRIQNLIIKKISHGASNTIKLSQEGILRRAYKNEL